MDFQDFILPVIIEQSGEYNPRKAKEQFNQISRLLACQAFWLDLFETLEKNKKHISGIKFVGNYFQGAEKWMVPVAAPGADPDKLAAIQRRFSKARGKFGNTSSGQRNMVAAVESAGLTARTLTLDQKEKVLKNSLGEAFYGLRLSSIEKKDIDQATGAALVQALAGKRKSSL